MRRWLLCSLLCLGCAHAPVDQAARTPASDWGGAFTKSEDETCSNFECENFVAPCDLLSTTRTRPFSTLEDKYRERIEAYKHIGYCLKTPRPLPAKDYAGATCFYLMERGEPCK